MSKLHLFSKSIGDGVKWEGTSIISICESFIKIWHQQPCQISTCPSNLLLESMRTWTFLEMVSDGREHPSEVFVTVSSMSDIRNYVKTPLVLQVSSWSLGWHGHIWWPVDGIRWNGTSIRSVCEILTKIRHQKPCQHSNYPPSLLLDSRTTWTFLNNL